MAETAYRVELTATFLDRLKSIKGFLLEADAAFAFDALPGELRATVIPNLWRFPRIGRRGTRGGGFLATHRASKQSKTALDHVKEPV